MKNILMLAGNDFKHIFRDRLLCVFLAAPLLLILFVRYFVPYVSLSYPELKKFYPVIMMFGSIQTAIMFGFISAFIILDEKDQNVLQAIRVLPLSATHFIIYRLLFSTVFSFLAAYLMIVAAGLAWPGHLNALLLSLQFGLAAPFITLTVASFAKNKIEGLALFKGLDLLLILPVSAFLFPGSWKFIFSPLPVFWTYEFYHRAVNDLAVLPVFFIGMTVCFSVLLLLARQFRKRVFN